MTSDSSFLFYTFLFHVRGALSSIKGASEMAKYHSDKMPQDILNWMEKWTPVVEEWASRVKESNSLFRDGEEHDWEWILQDMAENMKDISTAHNLLCEIEIPKSVEGEWVVKTAKSGSEHLNKVIQSILSKDYQYLLQH